MQVAGLLIDDLAISCRRVQYWKIRMLGELLEAFRFEIERENVELAVAVGTEVDRVAHPQCIGIVTSFNRLRYFLNGVVAELENRDLGMSTASIVFPLIEGRIERVIGQPRTIWREGCAIEHMEPSTAQQNRR